MKTALALLALLVAGCGTVEHARSVSSPDTVRLSTRAGSFEVREAVAAEMQKLLAGQPTEMQFFAAD